MRHKPTCILLLACVLSAPCNAQDIYAPQTMVRNMEKDSKGNIWLAAWKDVFRYDGKSYTNITSQSSSGNYWCVLEDRKGNFWFSTIGSGVSYYDGKSIKQFTTKEGLLNNEVGFIYEDKIGNIWFAANGGVSRYDGKSFRNYMISGDSMSEVKPGVTFPDFTRPPNEVNSIVEDKTGKFWFATRGHTFVYDGKKFTVFTNNGIGFYNTRSVIEDKKGNIWVGGNSGLWRFDGRVFTNLAKEFTGYIFEDKDGNIWTSAASGNGRVSSLYRFDGKTLLNEKPTVTEFKTTSFMLCGILEDNNGNIWIGAGDGVYRYDGKSLTKL